MLKNLILSVIILFTSCILVSAQPIQLDKNEINGIYIGKNIKYLSEKELFPLISRQWNAEKIFKEKITSGRLSTDNRFIVKMNEIPGGYQADMIFRKNKKTGSIQWGVKEILKPEILDRFRVADNKILKFNFMPHSYWLTFSINNRQNYDQKLYLELDKYLFSQFDIFYYKKNILTEKRANFSQGLYEREIKNKNMTVLITVQPGINNYYMRIDSWFLDVVPLRLWTCDSYYQYIAKDNAILGIITGIFILMLIYSLVIFIATRDIVYLYLSALILCTLIIYLAVSGFGFQHLWPESPGTGIGLLYGAFPFSLIFTLLFSRSFIGTYQYTPKINYYMFIVIAILIFLTILIYIVPLSFQPKIFVSIFFIDHLYYYPLFISTAIAIKRKNQYGYFLLGALLLYFISQAEWILTNLDIIPYRFVNYLNIKSISFIIIMMIGLGYKFRFMSGLVAQYKTSLVKANKKLTSKPITDQTKLKIEQVKEFLKENYHEDISREGLAAAVGMSPDHLGRIFKKSVGIKISEFINALRIKEAAALLKNEDHKIIDIAFSVGFENLRTFNKLFLSIYNLTPSEYRKK